MAGHRGVRAPAVGEAQPERHRPRPDRRRPRCDGGAEAVTLVNTVLGMAIDPDTGDYRLGSGPRGGGLSGPAIHPIAVRAVHDVHAALPDLPIVGVGGVASGADAAELRPGRRLGGPGRHGDLRRPAGPRPCPPGARGLAVPAHVPIHP